MSYDAKDLALWVNVTGVGDMEVVKFAADWELNSIPTATLSLALGRRMDTGAPSTAHAAADVLKQKQQALVYLNCTQRGILNQLLGLVGLSDLPNSAVVFDGLVSGFGERRSTSGAEFTISLEHWLANLNYSSAISSSIHPASPADLAFPCIAGLADPDNPNSPTGAGLIGMTAAAEIMTPTAVLGDLWGQALKKWFQRLASTNALTDVTFAGAAAQLAEVTNNTGPNSPALSALSRMEPTGLLGNTYSAGVKLSLNSTGIEAALLTLLAGNIQQELASQTIAGVAASTLWDILVQAGAQYMFSVVPRISSALVVPTMPVYRTDFKRIYASEYAYGELNGEVPRTLRTIGIFTGKLGEANAVFSDGTPNSYAATGIGGTYTSPNAPQGQILLRTAPAWLSENVPAYLDGTDATGELAVLRKSGVAPTKVVLVGPPANVPTAATQVTSLKLSLDRFAQALYGTEVLRHRSGWLTGKLRLDIAPGSIVSIEVPGEQFLGIDDTLGGIMYALVTRVSIMIDAQAQRAETTFHLAHIRTQAENQMDGLTVTAHPLWTQPFNGCSLV